MIVFPFSLTASPVVFSILVIVALKIKFEFEIKLFAVAGLVMVTKGNDLILIRGVYLTTICFESEPD